MSSGFVSGGTNEAPKERDAEWLQAQKDLETSRREKEEAATQEGGKSLYEILQANKAAKQSQYEESLRLKNQFRALDDDEIDFLDSVLESTRENERKIKQETVEMLDEFRKQRAEADQKVVLDDPLTGTGEGEGQEAGMSWGKKRKRKEKESKSVKGAKLRRVSTAEEASKDSIGAKGKDTAAQLVDEQLEPDTAASGSGSVITKATVQSKTLPQPASATSPTATSTSTSKSTSQQKPPPLKSKLGLVGYGSSDSESN